MIKKKILTIFFALLFCLAWTVSAYSGKKRINFSIGIQGSGLWIPNDEIIRDIYGTNFYPLGFNFRVWVRENFALEVSADFIYRSGRPLTLWGDPSPYGTAKMTLIPIQISAIYGISLDKDFSPYIGAGFSECSFEETLTLFGYSESTSQTTTGFHFFVGAQKFWKNFGVKSEIRYLSANIEGLQGKMDIGGIGIYWGLMVRFGI